MGPGTLSPASDLQPPAIHLNHGQRRMRLDARPECVGLESFHLLIALSLQLLADFLGQAAGLPRTDRQFGQILQDLARGLKGGLAGTGSDDLAQDGRAVVMRGEAQTDALREKNPGGKPGSGTWVHGR